MTYQNYAKCTQRVADSRIVVKEHKSKFTLCNASKLAIKKIQVDGCLTDGTTDQHKQCDWLFVVPTTEAEKKQRALYVELKGSDINKAQQQLSETIRQTKDCYATAKRLCFIVTTRVPSHGSTVQKMKKQFSQQGMSLMVKNHTLEYTI
jgi:hypothetical protein